MRKGSYDYKSNGKTPLKQYTQEELNELIDMAITHALKKNTQKDMNEINQEAGGETKTSQKSD